MNFKAKVIEKVSHGEQYWKTLKVGVFQDGEKIGEYERGYDTLFDTFFPFKQNGEWYALYSSDYTATSVMELPTCKQIASEEGYTHGFCPVEFYVPFDNSEVLKIDPESAGMFGFVSGCVWGDDSSYKIQFLDLSEITKGKISRDERLGYLETDSCIEDTINIKDAIQKFRTKT